MRLLAVSRSYLPSLGGVETTAAALARAWGAAGHEVRIATMTPPSGQREDEWPGVTVIRRAGAHRIFALHRWAELVWHNHLSLRAAWALALAPRPWVVTHQTWLGGGRWGIASAAKRAALPLAHSVAISRAIAADLPVPSVLIPNPYRSDLFRRAVAGARPFELAFLGRFVSDKGAHLLIEALARLAPRGVRPRLLMIGTGPEELRLRAEVARHGLSEQVMFVGPKRDQALAAALNEAMILVVPSLFAEPFGIVALEGIACGCAVIGSEGGGLPEAIGPCGVTFPNGNAEALALRIAELIASPESRERLVANAEAHLRAFTVEAVADRYLELFAALRGGGG